MVKMLTVLVSTISNSQVLLVKKNVSGFCKNYSHFLGKNISIYAILHDDLRRDGETLMLIHDKDYFVLVLIYCTKLYTS